MILKKFFDTVLNDPKKLALVTEKKEIDYLELYKMFSAYVIFFKKNINKNKKLIILLEDAEHILVSFLACLFLRITIFPINYETNLKDIEKISHEIKTSYILTDKKIKKTRSFNCIDVKK